MEWMELDNKITHVEFFFVKEAKRCFTPAIIRCFFFFFYPRSNEHMYSSVSAMRASGKARLSQLKCIRLDVKQVHATLRADQ